MADEGSLPEVDPGLSEVRSTLESLQQRMLAGEEIDEKELVAIARAVATRLEIIRSQLEEAVGGISPERLREEMERSLPREEYEAWLAGEQERESFRKSVAEERALREGLASNNEEEMNG